MNAIETEGAARIARLEGIKEFLEVDEALYRHEVPFYRACSGGVHFERTPEWDAERERLLKRWYELCPFKPLQKKNSNEGVVHAIVEWLTKDGFIAFCFKLVALEWVAMLLWAFAQQMFK